MLKNCISCGKQTKDYALVVDPEGDKSFARCRHCRQLSVAYKTPSEVEGP